MSSTLPVFSLTRATAAAFACLAAPALAGTSEDAQLWANATLMGSLKGRLSYFAEIQGRMGDDAGRLHQLLLRPAIGWKFSDALTVYGGYAHIMLPGRHGQDRNEERLFTQISWTLGNIAGGTLSSRTRLEHRRLSNGGDTGWRAREMIRYVHPVAGPKAPRALVWSEPFVALNDTDWGARGGFDQIRTFAGVELPLAGRSTIELGYLNQLINDPGGRKRMNHVASVTLFARP
ncbi:DUF2490 domain-containing protein [Sphingomonas quercus]|uniref:DUF2490 domain-containing protein n=1 Tax=Sphingomonas quercus TaxID=2842451 RepID=A0ABS6BFK5_9SPHN|nr:DUF2490 domain-containing protein [Sphingomonas quercus]MBU3077070.1 DUF2490 domain-containing protein [Sphingomonas quercus]